ncbi:MAG TPA: GNAT family N-acetyltransferase [Pseudonocardiaceae bacterium]
MNDHVDEVRARYAAAAQRLADVPVEQAGLSCGTPVADVELRAGDVVLDLGSGAGGDVLAAARRVGPTGRAIGLDLTQGMLDLARRHATEHGVTNAEFRAGRIEEIPLPDESVDVVVSNCVITLSPDKPRVFAEIARVLRPAGRVSISDLVPESEVDQYVADLVTAGLTGIAIRRGVEDAVHVTAARGRSTSRVVPMTDAHAERVLAIYQSGLDTGNASFETTAPDWARWDGAHRAGQRFVALDAAGEVVGWVAATPVSSRCVYAGVLEHSIYIRPDQHGRGIGRLLLDTYIAATEAAGVWTLQSGIFPENAGSLALHERAGFRVVGRRERVGQHHGTWRDVVLIERRSALVG